jgi:predicted aspartyl protease
MHQCPDKDLKVLVMDDVENEGEEARILAVELDEEDGEGRGEMSVLDLHHIALEYQHTMKFQGSIQMVEVLILVDSGAATHNFVSQKLAHQMDWTIESTPQMKVKLGNGVQVATQGVCRNLEIDIGGFKLSPNVHLFELGGIDVVLGMEWLKTLGDTITNWRQQSMSFWSNHQWVTLRGKEGCRKSFLALQNILGQNPRSKRICGRLRGSSLGRFVNSLSPKIHTRRWRGCWVSTLMFSKQLVNLTCPKTNTGSWRRC